MTPRTIVYGDNYEYTVQLILVVTGPEADPEHVAQRAAEKLCGKRLGEGFRVRSAVVDAPGDAE